MPLRMLAEFLDVGARRMGHGTDPSPPPPPRSVPWPDWVIAVAQSMFAVSLLPTLVGENKPEFATCVMTAVSLVGMMSALARLRQWGGAVACSVALLEWVILGVQTCQ
jgi:hypothetical protein